MSDSELLRLQQDLAEYRASALNAFEGNYDLELHETPFIAFLDRLVARYPELRLK